MSTPNAGARRAETDPLYFCGGSEISLRGESEFMDATYWGELAGKHLSRFNLPGWNVPFSPEEMRCWLDRLDLSERDYLTMTATRLADFIAINSAWPLRAWIGLVCELADEMRR